MLGRPTLEVGGRPVDFGTPRSRRLLAALLLEAGRQVGHDRLLSWVWDTDKSREALYEVVSDLRAALRPYGIALTSRDGWARLEVDPNSVDLHRLTALVERARDCDGPRRAELLGEAVRLGSGEPLEGLDGVKAESCRQGLRAKLESVALDHLGEQLRAGRSADCLDRLHQLFAEKPEHTRITALFMYALHIAGDTMSALDVHRRHYRALKESGLTMSEGIEQLRRRIAEEGPDVDAGAADFLGGEPYRDAEPVPPAAANTEAMVISHNRGNFVFGSGPTTYAGDIHYEPRDRGRS
ncbi:AfsR/SARP family transcriptional regulator [Saccharothrix australiensis]|uniref:DNA-binding SARP family transcriptional activator n=1 Tax=Saccharothrix australiensis TaxID=2072 RepID=A0A495VZS1_9PSEU|nr:bacterial transcriptional activator domain-containing protein [Saccharothrix australiensis]RKT54257.1 DNA-binding SARP family transcriptional activator [Saccharothrix australiensis]